MNSRSPFSKSAPLLSAFRKVAKCFLKKFSDSDRSRETAGHIFVSCDLVVVTQRLEYRFETNGDERFCLAQDTPTRFERGSPAHFSDKHLRLTRRAHESEHFIGQ